MTNPVSVDGEIDAFLNERGLNGLGDALWEFAEDSRVNGADRAVASFVSNWLPHYRTAILKHDPVVAYLAEELALEDPANPAVLAWREAVSGDSR